MCLSSSGLALTCQVLHIGNQSHILSTRPSAFRHEIYKCEPDRDRMDWNFSGLVSHSLAATQTNNNPLDGMDAALEEFRNSMASIQQEAEARKCVLASFLTIADR
jgi:hypothetical protein